MPPRDMGAKEIQYEILYRLYRRGCWGAKYLPTHSIVSWLGQLVRDDGHRVRVEIHELIGIGLLTSHKKGRTISLNSHMSKEIMDMLRDQA